jgi:glutathione S-transferase
MNTLEWMPIFLPALWLCAVYVGDFAAAGVGFVWIIGRIIYMVGYTTAAAKRNIGFGIQALAAGILLVTALVGIVMRIIQVG